MTPVFIAILFASNFVILSGVAGGVLYLLSKRYKKMNKEVLTYLHTEEARLEDVSADLMKIADALLNRLEAKEKDVKVLCDEYTRKMELFHRDHHANMVHNNVSLVPVEESAACSGAEDCHVRNTHEQYWSEDSKYKEIYYYADKGMRVVEIARKTGKTKGEIELILSLRKTKAVMTAEHDSL